MEETTVFSFSDFPEDAQLCILSFLNPAEIAIFACTSKRFGSLCRDDPRLWFAMCDRRWGSKTLITKWVRTSKVSYKLLYKSLQEFENLIGFWRPSCAPSPSPSSITTPISPPPLILFEWGSFYVTGFRVAPLENGSYKVKKVPFLWVGLTSKGEAVNYLDPDGSIEFSGHSIDWEELGGLGNDLVKVNVSFVGSNYIVVEELVKNLNLISPEEEGRHGICRVGSSNNVREEDFEEVYGSPGAMSDLTMLEIYQRFANPTSPGGYGAWRRQRRREKEKMGKKKWESEYFVKISNCSPTAARPLQGLWKGICDDMSLEFFLVAYDDIGGIACRKIGSSFKSSSCYSPVFWTSDTTFIESPFSADEELNYLNGIHVQSLAEADHSYNFHPLKNGAVTRMLYITSSYDLVNPDLAAATLNPRQVEGRVWQYGNGTFGFGFLQNSYIVDLKHIAQDGHLLDTVGEVGLGDN